MSFTDLDEFFDSSLKLPIGGKTYVIESPDAKTGLWCQRLVDIMQRAKRDPESLTDSDRAQLALSDDEERGLFERLMGDAFVEMIDDNIAWEKVKHAGTTTLIWAAGNVEAAEKFWQAGGRPEARSPKLPQDRRASARRAPQGSRGGSKTQTVPGQVLASAGGDSSSTGS